MHGHSKAIPDLQNSRLEWLDGLRGTALILVVWFHFWQQSWVVPRFTLWGQGFNLDFLPATGFMGVEIFIAIGALGLFLPFLSGRHKPDRAGWTDFFRRRALRILPSYYIVLAITWTIMQVTGQGGGRDWWHLLRHFLLVNNLSPDTYQGSFNGVTWFVAFQFQCYLIFPLLCWLFLRKPLTGFVLMELISALWRWWVSSFHPDQVSFLANQVPGYLDIFACGMLAAWLIHRLGDPAGLKRASRAIASAIFALSICLYLILMFQLRHNPGTLAQVTQLVMRPFFGFALVCILVSGRFAWSWLTALFRTRVMVFTGLISYNVFLWHQWLAVQVRISGIIPSGAENPQTDPSWQWPFLGLVTALSIALGVIGTWGIEKPLARWGDRLVKKAVVPACIFTFLVLAPSSSPLLSAQESRPDAPVNIGLVNPDFGVAGDSPTHPLPSGWMEEAWIKGEGAGTVRVRSGEGPDGSACLEIKCTTPNDLRIIQVLDLVPGTTYRASCKILARNVASQGVGACMSLAGTNLRSRDLKGGSGEWKEVEWYFECPREGRVRFALGIGGYGAICSGTALFDQVRLEQVTKVAPGTEVSGRGAGAPLPGTKTANPAPVVPPLPLHVWLLAGLTTLLGTIFLVLESGGRKPGKS